MTDGTSGGAAAAATSGIGAAAAPERERRMTAGRKRDAVHAFARVLRFDPAHAGALFHEGAILAEQRRYRDAIARWQRVIELAPSTDYARRARREIRTATDLQRVFGARVGA